MELEDSLMIGIGAAILFALIILIAIQSRMLKLLSNRKGEVEVLRTDEPEIEDRPRPIIKAPAKTGLSKGEAKLLGQESDEEVAVIIAAVSHAANIPLANLRIKSIKRIEN